MAEKNLSDRDTALILDKISALEKQVQSMQKSLDILAGDQDEDRKHFTEWDIRMGAIETRLKELADKFRRLTRDVVSSVEEAIDEAPKEIATQVLSHAQKKTKGGKALKVSLFKRIWG